MAKAADKKLNTKKTALIIGGAIATYLLYRLYESRAGGTAASGSASYVPAVMPGSGASTTTSAGSGSGSGAGGFATLADWEQAVLGTIGPQLGAAQALNSIGSWLNGNCVSAAAYQALGSAVEQHGLPPGFGYGVPTLSVCPGTGGSGTPVTSVPHGSGSGTSAPPASTPPASSGTPVLNLPPKIPNPLAGLTEVSLGEAKTYKSQGASVLAGPSASPWKGPGSSPGSILYVATQWLAKHGGRSGQSGPGNPSKTLGPWIGKPKQPSRTPGGGHLTGA